jgi:DNA-binding IclR family transcriptional regulator
MVRGRDQAREIYDALAAHPGSTVAELVAHTGWHELVVFTALKLMAQARLVRLVEARGEGEAQRYAVIEGRS